MVVGRHRLDIVFEMRWLINHNSDFKVINVIPIGEYRRRQYGNIPLLNSPNRYPVV